MAPLAPARGACLGRRAVPGHRSGDGAAAESDLVLWGVSDLAASACRELSASCLHLSPSPLPLARGLKLTALVERIELAAPLGIEDRIQFTGEIGIQRTR